MATRERRHRNETPPRRGPIGPMICTGLILATLVSALVVAALADDAPQEGTHEAAPTTQTATTPGTTPTPEATTTTSPTEDLVVSAQRIKPLEDIEKGDRVIYQGDVCTWLKWEGDINVSTIRCEERTFDIQTGRLTPVEHKDGPSKLKVRR